MTQDFYEDIFEELAKFGEIENLNVCDNLADHMVGSVYVKFSDEEGAAAALQGLQGRFYGGRPIQIEFSPVTDFREATCRQYEENTCTRGGYCNFMHLRPISRYISITVISITFWLGPCMTSYAHVTSTASNLLVHCAPVSALPPMLQTCSYVVK